MAGYRGKIRKRRIRAEWDELQAGNQREQQRRFDARVFIGTTTMRTKLERTWFNLGYLWCGAVDEQTRAKIASVTR